MVDTDNNGVIDTYAYDQNQNGQVDAVLIDADEGSFSSGSRPLHAPRYWSGVRNWHRGPGAEARRRSSVATGASSSSARAT